MLATHLANPHLSIQLSILLITPLATFSRLNIGHPLLDIMPWHKCWLAWCQVKTDQPVFVHTIVQSLDHTIDNLFSSKHWPPFTWHHAVAQMLVSIMPSKGWPPAWPIRICPYNCPVPWSHHWPPFLSQTLATLSSWPNIDQPLLGILYLLYQGSIRLQKHLSLSQNKNWIYFWPTTVTTQVKLNSLQTASDPRSNEHDSFADTFGRKNQVAMPTLPRQKQELVPNFSQLRTQSMKMEPNLPDAFCASKSATVNSLQDKLISVCIKITADGQNVCEQSRILQELCNWHLR